MLLTPVDPNSVHLSFETDLHRDKGFTSRTRRFKNLVLIPYKLLMMVGTVINCKIFRETPTSLQAPRVQKLCEYGTHLFGLNPSYPYFTELYLPDSPFWIKKIRIPYFNFKIKVPLPKIPILTKHLANEATIGKEILKYHRNEEFSGNMLCAKLRKEMKNVYLTDFKKDDTLFTCKEEYTAWNHTNIKTALKPVNINQIIKAEGDQLIARWNYYADHRKTFDLTSETRLFTNSVLTQTLFGGSKRCAELVEAVNIITKFNTKTAKKINKVDLKEYEKACKTFRDITDEFINSNKSNLLPIFHNNPENGNSFTHKQKQALCFFMFFAGQGTTSFMLDQILATLALDHLQQLRLAYAIKNHSDDKPATLYNIPEITKIIDDYFLKFSPVDGLERLLKADTIISFATSRGKVFKKFMRKGEVLTPQILPCVKEVLCEKQNNSKEGEIDKNLHQLYLSKANVFGYGKNQCVGQTLALNEITQLLTMILRNFDIFTGETEYKLLSNMTNHLEPYFIRVKRKV